MSSLPHVLPPLCSNRLFRSLLVWLGLLAASLHGNVVYAQDLFARLEELYQQKGEMPVEVAHPLLQEWRETEIQTAEDAREVLCTGGFYLYQFFVWHNKPEQLLPLCNSVLNRLEPWKAEQLTEYRTWQGRITESKSYLGQEEAARTGWLQLLDSLTSDQPVDSLFVGEVYLQLTKQAYRNGWFQAGLEYGAAGIRYLDRFDDTNMFSNLLLSIGRIYNSQGDYVQAITHFRRAIDILETIPEEEFNAPALTLPYVEVAMAYGNQGKDKLCRDFYQKAVDVMAFPTVKYFDQITILGNLAGKLRGVDNEKSMACIDRALDVYQLALKEGEPVSENSRRILQIRKGRLMYLTGHFDQSQQLLIRVLNESARAQDQFPALFAANVLVTRSLEMGDPMQALNWWQVGYRILHRDYSLSGVGWEQTPDLSAITPSQNLARFFLHRAKALLALPGGHGMSEEELLFQAREAVMTAQNFLLQVRRGQRERDQEFNSIFQECQGFRLAILERQADVEQKSEMFQLMDRGKVMSLQEDWLMEQRKQDHLIPDSVRQQLEALEREVIELEAAIFDDELVASYDSAAFRRAYANKATLVDRSRELHQLEKQVADQYPSFTLSDNQYPFVPVGKVREQLLSPRSAVVSYFYSSHTLFAALLTRDTVHIHSLSVDSSFLQTLRSVIDGCRKPGGDQTAWAQASQQLFLLILDPLTEKLPSGIEELMIVPDGPLVELPFEVLVLDPDAGSRPRYLLDRFSLSYWLSVRSRLMIEQPEEEDPAGQLASFAPEYPEPGPALAMLMERDSAVSRLVREGEFYLPGATQEATLIADMWNGQVYKGAGVSEQEFLEEAGNFTVLHLAMHALVEKDQEQFSRLLFASSEDSGRGFLSAMEIAGMDLPAELVVLSACNTGRGKWRAGEGVFHLGRAFRMAGVRSLVLSLWQVPDQATSELMPAFYQSLKDGATKSEALRRAKLAYLDAADPAMQAPYYWAGFILIGDQAPIQLPESRAWWWIPALLLGVVAGLGIWIRIRQKQGIHEDNRSNL